MNTIRLGSTGPDVKQWQGILKLKADGIFGSATESGTKAFQRSHKLAADGVVGPATWSAAGIAVTASTGKTTAAPTDLWAYNIAKTAAPDMKEPYRQYALSVARGEGFFGNGWGSDPALGAGSNNWGAVQGTGDAGAFQHIDHHADGTQYTTNFKRYSTPQAGFLDMARILLKDNVKAALDKGNLHDAVFAQHSNRYFELDPTKYLSAVVKNYTTLTSNVEWKKLLGENGVTSIVGKVVGALGVAVLLFLGYSKVRHG